MKHSSGQRTLWRDQRLIVKSQLHNLQISATLASPYLSYVLFLFVIFVSDYLKNSNVLFCNQWSRLVLLWENLAKHRDTGYKQGISVFHQIIFSTVAKRTLLSLLCKQHSFILIYIPLFSYDYINQVAKTLQDKLIVEDFML